MAFSKADNFEITAMLLDEKEKELFSSSCSKYVALSSLKCFAGEQKSFEKERMPPDLTRTKIFLTHKIFKKLYLQPVC